jgi:hypothetical protein
VAPPSLLRDERRGSRSGWRANGAFRERASEAAWTLAAEAEAEGNPPLAARWARVAWSWRHFGSWPRRLLALLDRAGDRPARPTHMGASPIR